MESSEVMEALQIIVDFFDRHFWPLIFLLVVVIFRKGIGEFVKRIIKFSFSFFGASGAFEAVPPTPEAILEVPPETSAKAAEPSESSSGPEEQKEKEEAGNWFSQAHTAISEGDLARAEEIFQANQQTEDDADQRHSNESFYLYDLYKDGNVREALTRLEALHAQSANDKQLENSIYWLAWCYRAAKDYDKTEELWQDAISEVTNEKIKTTFTIALAQVHKDKGAAGPGIELLENRLLDVHANDQRASIYRTLSTLEKENGDGEAAAIALEKAVQLLPGDRSRLFDAAYLQSQENLRQLSVANYQTLLSLDNAHATAFNNLGVCAGQFKLPGKAIAFYRRSIEEGSTLAMANVANEQIDAGFWDEAHQTIETARKTDEPHENVGNALYRLQKSKDSEEEKWNDLNKKAEVFQRKVRTYGSAFFARLAQPIACHGTWYTPRGEDVNVEVKGVQIDAEWTEIRGLLQKNKYKCSIIGTLRNRSARMTYRRRGIDEKPLTLLGSSSDETVRCFSYFSPDHQEWHFFSIDHENELAFTLYRKKPNG